MADQDLSGKITEVHILCARVDERTQQNAVILKELRKEAQTAMKRIGVIENRQSVVRASWLAIATFMSAMAGVLGAWVTRHFH